ncbi:lipid IV(A) palmitoyltransferase PagP [Moellerella wisconsensis]|uniref:Lipid A acyltransferase PagP n=1 Tax=Moellerella wisconsensis ATCC 35017 TaxID=1354267 RepID=A0A0N0IAD1_9GAMM|nr:lipid IV(A) palmitoyltransferase PagP [Moellerella wisconsensis]KPD02621.1 lipid A palmitoyltransferase [Moellerella wisconsensis ATCC 35017]VFS53138.1 Lipid A palmitoyltransferase PagP precursor [Moellerella wisconsensis]
MTVKNWVILAASSTIWLSSATCSASSTSDVAPASINTPGLWDKFTSNVSKTWDSPEYEVYLPALTWHNRLTYDKKKTDRYNETPWGLGLGKYRYDEDNDWHSLYAMAFMDSNDKVEPIIGYGFQKMWIPGDIDGFRMGAGFTLSITARHEYNYIPIPLPLPLVSVEYNRLAFQATYVPGTYNNGNVLFAWLRWQW